VREFRIYVAERVWDGDWVYSCNLLYGIVEALVGKRVVRTNNINEADLNILNVFDLQDGIRESGRRRGRRRGLRWNSPIEQGASNLESVLAGMGVSQPTIIQVAENLDRPEWKQIGALIRASDVPRATFWPREIDPQGVRLPYWWNYVRWPELPRPRAQYQRYGSLYELDALLAPLDPGLLHSKHNKAVLVSANMEFPRAALVREVERFIPVEVLGGTAGSGRPKRDILKGFRYALVPENSLGYGYCTEKVPEAWMSGCLPLGVTQQPWSDWPQLPCVLDPRQADSGQAPLLHQRPSLDGVIEYVSRVLDGQ